MLALIVISACTLTDPQPSIPTAAPQVTVVTETPLPTTPTATLTPTATPTLPPTLTPTPVVSLIPPPLMGDSAAMYVRERPSTMSKITRAVSLSAPWEPIGRASDNQWIEIRFSDGFTGWIAYNPAAHTISLDALPISGEGELIGNIVLVTAPRGTLYNDAGDGVVGDLTSLTSLHIDGRSNDNAWLHGTDTDGRTGWIANEGVNVTFLVDSVPGRDFSVLENVRVSSSTQSNAPPPVNFESNARVRLDSGGLRLRQTADRDGTILLNLIAGSEVVVQAFTADNAWARVQLREGYTGWVSTSFLEPRGDWAGVPIDNDPQPVPYFVPPTPEGGPAVTVMGGGAAQIYATGRSLGNRANIFTTVGDSLTDSAFFLRDIVNGYDLGQYGYLLPTIQYFNADTGQGNAFARRSFAAHAGWSTFSVLEVHPEYGQCQPGEVVLECEYRLTQPAFAVIMIGTNDSPAFPSDTYRANMQQILDISIRHGVVPILSTLPPRGDSANANIQAYNGVIVQLAATYGVPLTDLYSAVAGLPNSGLAPDGLHLSEPPGGYRAALVFNAANLAYGTTMRNLTVLQALAQVHSQLG